MKLPIAFLPHVRFDSRYSGYADIGVAMRELSQLSFAFSLKSTPPLVIHARISRIVARGPRFGALEYLAVFIISTFLMPSCVARSSIKVSDRDGEQNRKTIDDLQPSLSKIENRKEPGKESQDKGTGDRPQIMALSAENR